MKNKINAQPTGNEQNLPGSFSLFIQGSQGYFHQQNDDFQVNKEDKRSEGFLEVFT